MSIIDEIICVENVIHFFIGLSMPCLDKSFSLKVMTIILEYVLTECSIDDCNNQREIEQEIQCYALFSLSFFFIHLSPDFLAHVCKLQSLGIIQNLVIFVFSVLLNNILLQML